MLICLNACACNPKQTITNNLSILNPSINSFNCWTLFDEQSLMYTTSFPIYSNSNTLNRKLHYIMLVYDKNQNSYIISVVGGKNYKKLSEVIIKINYNEYSLPTSKDRAWLTNKNLLEYFIKDMQQSNNFIIISSFNDETNAIDTYSLEGFNKTYELMNNK